MDKINADNTLTVKEYSEKVHISKQCIYKKIDGKAQELNGHIFKINGVTRLDETAQEILKPVGGNIALAEKAANAEKKTAEYVKQNKILTRSENEKSEEIQNLQFRLASYESDVKILQKELSEKNAEIKKLIECINELTEKNTELQKTADEDFRKFAERLDRIFAFFEDSKNSGLVKKIGNYINKG